MNTVTVVVAIVILAIAFKKEIVSLCKTIGKWFALRQERAQERKLSPETKRLLKNPAAKKFFLVMGAIVIIAAVVIATFLISILILPKEAGYAVGGVLALAELFGGIALCIEVFNF